MTPGNVVGGVQVPPPTLEQVFNSLEHSRWLSHVHNDIAVYGGDTFEKCSK
jgi:hypothetical protein